MACDPGPLVTAVWVGMALCLTLGFVTGFCVRRSMGARRRREERREYAMYPGGRPAPIRGVQPWHDMNEDPGF